MKRFAFSLDRVLRWRATQLRLAESRLEQLQGSLRQTEASLAQVAIDRDRALADVIYRPVIESTELEGLENIKQYALRETERLRKLRERFLDEVRTQAAEVRERRRQKQLLEKLREKRYAEWEALASAELRQLADDSHLSKLVRESLEAAAAEPGSTAP